MKKKITSVIIVIVMLIITTFAVYSCIKQGPEMTYGDFVYCYVTSANSNRRAYKAKYVAILGLTEDGKKKQTIIIPETIKGKPVILIGMRGMAWNRGLIESGGIYSKIYLPNTLQQVRNDSSDIAGYRKKFLLNFPNDKFFQNLGGVFYVPENEYLRYKNFCQEDRTAGNYKIIKIANLTYIVDEKVYWIDDYEEDEYIIFPEEPKKEGYKFDGWYKDIEYLTEWNEKTDKFNKAEEIETINLYAKWIENK